MSAYRRIGCRRIGAVESKQVLHPSFKRAPVTIPVRVWHAIYTLQSDPIFRSPLMLAPPPGSAEVVVTPLTELVVLYLPTMYKYCACKGTRFPSTPYNICGPPSPVARFLRNYTSHLHTFWSCVIINTLAVLFIPDLFVSGPFYFRTKLFPHLPLDKNFQFGN